jgi:NAD(P)-dependent dehydrogenase (short-subunit alcohol dehydrogenase family)
MDFHSSGRTEAARDGERPSRQTSDRHRGGKRNRPRHRQGAHAAGARVIGFEIASAKDVRFEMLGVDVADSTSVHSGIGAAVAEFGAIDIVVNSAGIEIPAPLAGLDMAVFDRMYAVNV